MFDIEFRNSMALRLVSVIWVICIVLAVIALISAIGIGIYISGDEDQPTIVVLAFIFGSWVVTALWLLFVRIVLEGVAAIFRIVENSTAIAESARLNALYTDQVAKNTWHRQ